MNFTFLEGVHFATKKKPKGENNGSDDIVLPAGPFRKSTVIKQGTDTSDTKRSGIIAGFGDPEKLGHVIVFSLISLGLVAWAVDANWDSTV